MKTKNKSREQWVLSAIEQYQSSLLGYAYNITRNYTLSQDVVQDTFLKLCKADREKVDEYMKAWLFKVCRNRALEILRKEQKMETLTDKHVDSSGSDTPNPYDIVNKGDSFLQATELINKLPEKHRDIIYLKFQNGLNYKEISKVTGLSVSNIGFILHNSLKKLRTEMV